MLEALTAALKFIWLRWQLRNWEVVFIIFAEYWNELIDYNQLCTHIWIEICMPQTFGSCDYYEVKCAKDKFRIDCLLNTTNWKHGTWCFPVPVHLLFGFWLNSFKCGNAADAWACPQRLSVCVSFSYRTVGVWLRSAPSLYRQLAYPRRSWPPSSAVTRARVAREAAQTMLTSSKKKSSTTLRWERGMFLCVCVTRSSGLPSISWWLLQRYLSSVKEETCTTTYTFYTAYRLTHTQSLSLHTQAHRSTFTHTNTLTLWHAGTLNRYGRQPADHTQK